MSQRPNHFKLGLFVIGAIASFVLLLMVVGAGSYFSQGIVIETYLDESVQGLDVGSPCKYRGVQVGSIKEIGFVRDYYETDDGSKQRWIVLRVELTMSSNADRKVKRAELIERVKKEVPEGMRIRLTSQGITGLSFLEIDYYNVNRFQPMEIDWNPSEIYVPSAPSTGSQISNSIDTIASGIQKIDFDKISAMADSIVATIDSADMGNTLATLQKDASVIAANLSESSTRLNEILNRPEVEQIIVNSASITANTSELIRESKPNIAHSVEQFNTASDNILAASEDMAGLIEDVSETMDIVREAGNPLIQTIQRLETMLERANFVLSSQQSDVDAIVDNVRDITSNVLDVTELAKKYPSLILFGDAPEPLENKQ